MENGNTKMMDKIIWDEVSIREEIKKLDAITGLDGAKLPIRFNKAKNTLASYYGGMKCYFTFSDYYFKNPDWPKELAVDTIRHEYAHYMDDCIYGNLGHGKTWKLCCNKIGAIPVRCYSRDQEDYWKNVYRKRREEQERQNVYKPGILLLHPQYGFGTIESVEETGTGGYVMVSFEKNGLKKLSLSWVAENCAGEL